MFSHIFGNYLVEQGVLTEELLESCLEEQYVTRVKLGVIAEAEGFMSKEQADEVNMLQQNQDRKFGDIAIEKGYLTREQLEMVLKQQGNQYMKFLQMLVSKANLSIQTIDTYINNFKEAYGFSGLEVNAIKSNEIGAIVPLFASTAKPYITELVGLVVRNISRFISTRVYIERIRPVEEFDYLYLTGQKAVGDYEIYVALACDDKDSFLQFASAYAKEEFRFMKGEVFDVIGEFLNCVDGMFAAKISNRGIVIDLFPAVTYANQTAKGQAYIVPIMINKKNINLYIAVDSEISLGEKPLIYELEREMGSKASKKSKGNVVIVDDSKMSRRILRSILEEEGYTVVFEAIDGEEAVTAYKKYNPDIVTLDITMPKRTGLDALRDIKEIDANANVIIISAAGQQHKIIEALKLGAGKYITKPYKKEEVLDCLKNFK